VQLKDHPVTSFHEGNYQKTKPLIMGTVLEEGWLFIYSLFPTTNMSNGLYEGAVKNVFGSNTEKVLALYPPDRTSPPEDVDDRPIISLLATDFIFYCSGRYMAHAVSDFNVAPLYIYRFDQIMSFDGWGDANPYCVGHVCHGSEVAYVYQSWADDNSGFTVTPEEQALADAMTLYWANFAKTGNPNTPAPVKPPVDFINWPRFNWSTEEILTMNATFQIARNYRKPYCDTFDTFGPIPYISVQGSVKEENGRTKLLR